MIRRLRPILFVALLAGACSEEDDTPQQGAEELGEQDKEEVARSLGTALSRSFSSEDGLATTSIDVAAGAPPAWLGEIDVGVYAGELLGLTIDVDVECVDSAGAQMAECGPDTASASITADVDGELSLLGWTGSLGLSGSWQLAALQEEEIEFQGSASIELASEFEDWFEPVTHTATFTISGELDATLRRSDAQVVSGTAQLAIEYERTRSDEETGDRFEFTVDATLEDGQASITVGGLDFRIDLSTGSATRL
jgi:hypothetical protein